MSTKDEPAFELIVPLDASGIDNPTRPVKVAVFDSKGEAKEHIVHLRESKTPAVAFTFEGQPGRLRVVVGPENASLDDLRNLQTLSRDVSARQFREHRLVLEPILISPYYWRWWLWWCREFTITGRVVCANGAPVPGATVCAYDVDAWWWWISEENVGCATTDANGAFTLTFSRCCGWFPIWWWARRTWRIEPYLAERIVPVLQGDPRLNNVPVPSPRPSLAVFDALLEARRPQAVRTSEAFDPAALSELRGPLLQRVPAIAGFERLWPWREWWPWWDCEADIILRVTQNCHGQNTVVHNEGYFDTRWDMATSTDVTLVATENACCIPQCTDPGQCPEGDCVIVEGVCDPQNLVKINTIGGNFGAPSAPVGYANPGLVSASGDQPFGGRIPIRGIFGDLADVDYYEIQWSLTGAAGSWNAMPPAAAGDFTRTYWGPHLGGGAVDMYDVNVAAQLIDGHNVFESVAHFEAATGFTPGVQYWTDNNGLMSWLTENSSFADGTYYLQVIGYKLSGTKLVDPQVLPQCDLAQDNSLVLTIDNRLVGPAAGHPLDHACDGGTVHTCTTEPDDNIFGITINGVAVNPCDIVKVVPGQSLEIDFMAHDPDGHLGYYTLDAVWGLGNINNLVTSSGSPLAGASLLAGPPHGGIAPASQVGPNYGAALGQLAVSPIWRGGTLRLSVPDVTTAFPKPCAYTLQLWAYKRTIFNCTGQHANLSEFSLTITY
jgi:hypothetical protein